MAGTTSNRTVRRASSSTKRTAGKAVRRTSAPRQKSFSVRTDPVLKQQVDIFLQSVGMSMSTAINLYLRKIVLEQRIPFEISLPPLSPESRAALLEAEELKKPGVGKVFKTVDELREDLLS